MSQMSSRAVHDGGPNANWWKRLAVLFAAVLAAAIAVMAFAWISVVGPLQQDKKRLEGQVASLQSQVDRTAVALGGERAKNNALAKINLEAFLYDYNNLLDELKQAFAAYEAAKRLPLSDRGGAVESAKRALYTRIDAFMTFITRWRSVAETLNDLLDGNVTRMELARRNDNAESIQDGLNPLIIAFPSLKQQLEVKINILKSQ